MNQPIPSLLCMLTTPGSASDERWRPSLQPQPYQAAVIRSIEGGDKMASLMAVFATRSMAAAYSARAISPWLRLPADQSPTLGRKRRRRRARGRQIQMNQRGHHA